MADLFLGLFALIGLGVVLMLALNGLAQVREPVEADDDIGEQVHATVAAAKAAMYDVADRSAGRR